MCLLKGILLPPVDESVYASDRRLHSSAEGALCFLGRRSRTTPKPAGRRPQSFGEAGGAYGAAQRQATAGACRPPKTHMRLSAVDDHSISRLWPSANGFFGPIHVVFCRIYAAFALKARKWTCKGRHIGGFFLNWQETDKLWCIYHTGKKIEMGGRCDELQRIY